MITGKVWGTTEDLWKTPFIEVHRLYIKPGMQCSNHCHAHKWNGFYVISGQLTIVVSKNDYDLTDETVLVAGDFTAVKPGEYHRFVSHDETVEALEIYSPEALSEDIIRKDCGGLVA